MKNYHYYSEHQEDLHSNPADYDFHFKEHYFKFHTDDGVFSKNYIDYGSFALLKAYELPTLDGPLLDMGAGYGPIGIVLATLFKREVHCCEINERAFSLLEKNIKTNQCVNVVPYHSNLFSELPPSLKFASVITNPPIRAGKDIVRAVYEGAYERLLSNGTLWVVIQKKQGAPSSKDYIEHLFGNCEIVQRDKGYYILRAIKQN